MICLHPAVQRESSLAYWFQRYGKSYDALYQTNADFLLQVNKNLYEFSGAKAFQELLLFNSQLVDANGRIKPFGQYRKDLQKLNLQFNDRYLRTEYNTALKTAQHAKKWHDIEANKDLYPNIRYRTVGDSKVRDEHAALEGQVWPVEHSFWDKYYPPNDWNCRCYAEPTQDKASDGKVPDVPLKPNFDNNAGKYGVIFTKKGSYFDVPEDLTGKYALIMEEGKLKAPMIDFTPKGSKGRVLVSPFADPVDFGDNLAAAKLMANELELKIKIMPHIKRDLLPGKNPEYEILGQVADLKGKFIKDNYSAIKNAFKAAKAQNLTIIVFDFSIFSEPLNIIEIANQYGGFINANRGSKYHSIITIYKGKVVRSSNKQIVKKEHYKQLEILRADQ